MLLNALTASELERLAYLQPENAAVQRAALAACAVEVREAQEEKQAFVASVRVLADELADMMCE